MKVLFAGSRKWLSQAPIAEVINRLPPDTIVIHGAAPGVDNIAGYLAELRGLKVRRYPALAHGRKWPEAGPLRNQEMLDEEHPDKNGELIDEAYLFHEDPGLGRGTKDMRQRLDEASPLIQVHTHTGRGR